MVGKYHKGDRHAGGGGHVGGGGKNQRPVQGWEKGDVARGDADDAGSLLKIPVKPGRDPERKSRLRAAIARLRGPKR